MTYSPSDVEGWAAAMRQELRVAPPASGTIKTPDALVRELDEVDSLSVRAVWVVKEADKVRGEAQKALLRAEASATKAATGKNQELRRAAVLEATAVERDASEVAQIAYRYAKGVAELLEQRKSSLQTQAKLVIATYQVSGVNR